MEQYDFWGLSEFLMLKARKTKSTWPVSASQVASPVSRGNIRDQMGGPYLVLHSWLVYRVPQNGENNTSRRTV